MYDKKFNKPLPEFSAKIKSGDKRQYFIDIQKTKFNDFYIVISETLKKHESEPPIRNKIHLYKEDVNKFISELENAVSYLKNNLLPDYDFNKTDRPHQEKRFKPRENNYDKEL